jgi:hypothetical protein
MAKKIMFKQKELKMDQEGFRLLVKEAQKKLGCWFFFYCIFVFPLVVMLFLGMATAAIASLVFGIQALVVGSATYQGQPCENTIGVWMIVYGSLGVAGAVLSCICPDKSPNKTTDPSEDQDKTNPCSCLASLIMLVNAGWVCYGMYLVYDNPLYYEVCNASQFQVFKLIVQFNFFIGIAVLGLMAVVSFCLCPIMLVFYADDCECVSTDTMKDEESLEHPSVAKIPATNIVAV